MTDLLDLSRAPAPKPKPERVTASLVKAALRARYRQPEWALLFEVGDATGARHTRFADAVAMSLWPSRGLDLHGMEIKVSRHDWQTERNNPAKAETIAAYCDCWWLVSGPGVVHNIDEIPSAWGWIECDGTRLAILKQPAPTEAKVCDRKFLAALLRRAHKTDEAMIEAELAQRDARREAEFQARVRQQAERTVRDNGDLRAAVQAFEEAAGFSISDKTLGFWSGESKRVGEAVKLVRDLKLAEAGYGSLTHVVAEMQTRLADMMAVMSEAGLLPGLPEALDVKPKARRGRSS